MQLLNIQIPEHIADVFHKITGLANEKQVKIFVVGGFVRDLLMGQEIQYDLDFVLEGDAIHFARAFRKRFGGTKVVAYNRFGTAMLQHKKIKLEFVTAREEYYEEHSRKPHVKKADILSDLSRRDFTINAMAICLSGDDYGKLFDPFQGKDDLKEKIIRTPLDPEITFYDDPLRMLRAIRFASRFHFQIEDRTWRSLQKEKERIKIISVERITEELFKMLLHKKPSGAFRLLKESGLLQLILPELHDLDIADEKEGIAHKNIWEHSLMVLDQMAGKTEDLQLRLAALFHDIGKPQTKAFDSLQGWTFYKHEEMGAQIIKDIGRRLKFSNQMIKFISGYTRYHQWAIQLIKEVDRLTDSAIRRFLVEVGELVDGLILLAECDLTTSFPEKRKTALENVKKFKKRIRILEEKEEWRRFKLAITGEDIMSELGLPQGKIVGEIKNQIQDLVISGELENDRSVLIRYLKEYKNKRMEKGNA